VSDNKIALALAEARAPTQPLKDNALAAVDLERLKNDFIASQDSLASFCQLHPEAQGLHARATRDGWLQQRAAFREAVSREARARMLEKATEVEAKLDRAMHRSAKKFALAIRDVIDDAFVQHERARESNGADGKLMSLDDFSKLKNGMEVLEKAHRMARVTAGLTPEPLPGRQELDLSGLDPNDLELLEGIMKKAARHK